jgi:hypothetical protein
MKRDNSQTLQRSRRLRSTDRSGAAAVEATIALGVFFLVCLAMFDLGLATFRHNALSAAARGIAREAIVRGIHAPNERTSWGPTAFAALADDSSEIASLASQMIPTMPADEVHVSVTWPDGEIGEGDRVHVRLDFEHKCFVSLFVVGDTLPLKAETTMRIVN